MSHRSSWQLTILTAVVGKRAGRLRWVEERIWKSVNSRSVVNFWWANFHPTTLKLGPLRTLVGDDEGSREPGLATSGCRLHKHAGRSKAAGTFAVQRFVESFLLARCHDEPRSVSFSWEGPL